MFLVFNARSCRNFLTQPHSKSFLKRFLSKDAKPNTLVFDRRVEFHLKNIKEKYDYASQQLMRVDLTPNQIMDFGKQVAELTQLVQSIDKRQQFLSDIEDMKILEKEELSKGSDGFEMVELARQERAEHELALQSLENDLVKLLTPKDKDDNKGIVLEVRAGTGGDEASLFAGEVFRMYQKYALLMGWKWEELSLSRSEIGGFKEAQAQISGGSSNNNDSSVFKFLKFESGVHRVQRIPINDTKIQTSACSVIVLPAASELDVDIRPQDLRIDVYRSGGAGGQSVNKTESAVRITHLPTGLVVAMQDERSQIQNRAKAMRFLLAKLYDFERKKQQEAQSELRSAAHGTGDRSDKIRTYNFPQDRVTDHRVSVTISGVNRVMNGEVLHDIIQPLVDANEADRLTELLEKLSQQCID